MHYITHTPNSARVKAEAVINIHYQRTLHQRNYTNTYHIRRGEGKTTQRILHGNQSRPR
jgi:hypothetical protein